MSKVKELFQNQECLTAKQVQTYLQNKMEATEVHQVESHMLDCPLCAAAVEGLEASSFTVEDQERLQKLESTFLSPKKETPVRKLNTNRFLLNRIAASILFLLIPMAAFLYWNNTTLSRSYSAHYEALSYDNSTRGALSSKADPMLKNAMESYSNKHYEASVEQFEKYFEKENENAQAKLYAGIAALESGYYTKAEDFLATVRINNERYFDEATWYLAMTHLKQENKAETLVLLDELLQDEKGFYYQKASNLKASLVK